MLAVAVFAVCGTYQLSSLKDRCLAHCRSPLALLLHYGSYQGRFRDLRIGAHHGGYCLGCCWGLMVILIAVGMMNVAVMVGLAALVLIEKVWPWGPAAGRLAGAAALALAVATIWFPWLAPGLHALAADDELIPPKRQRVIGCRPGTATAGRRHLPGRRLMPAPMRRSPHGWEGTGSGHGGW